MIPCVSSRLHGIMLRAQMVIRRAAPTSLEFIEAIRTSIEFIHFSIMNRTLQPPLPSTQLIANVDSEHIVGTIRERPKNYTVRQYENAGAAAEFHLYVQRIIIPIIDSEENRKLCAQLPVVPNVCRPIDWFAVWRMDRAQIAYCMYYLWLL